MILLDEIVSIGVDMFTMFEDREHNDGSLEIVWGPFPGIHTQDFLTVFLNVLTDCNSGVFEIHNIKKFFEDFDTFAETLKDNVMLQCCSWNQTSLNKYNLQKTKLRYIDWLEWRDMLGAIYNKHLFDTLSDTAKTCSRSFTKLKLTDKAPTSFYSITMSGTTASFSRVYQPILVPGTMLPKPSEDHIKDPYPVTFVTDTNRAWLYDCKLNRININQHIDNTVATFIGDFPGVDEQYLLNDTQNYNS